MTLFWKNLIQFIGDDMCYGIKKVNQVGGIEVRRIGWCTNLNDQAGLIKV